MANRSNTFLLKRSNVLGKIPVLSGLTLGELALNTADAKLYTLYTGGLTGATEVREIGWNRLSISGGTITGDILVTGSVSATTFYGDGQYLTGISSSDNYVTGGTYSNGTLTLGRQNGSVTITGFTTTTLSATSLNVDYIDFNQNYAGATAQGRINWDTGTGTLNIGVGSSGTTLIDLQVGQEEIVRVYNDAGSTLNKGEVVYVSGSQGQRPAVKRASAVGDGYSVTTLGMVDAAITSGAEGYVTTFGIISNLNTNAYTGGTPIWLSPTTPGGFTDVKPQAPYHTVLLGYVVRQHPSSGSIFVNISNGWELDELHDVRISGVTEGDLLIRSSYSGSPVWVNSKTLKGDYTISGNTNNIGNFSATTFYGSGLGLNNIPIAGVTNLQNSLDLKTDLTLFNLHTGNTNNPHQTSFYQLISTAHTHTISDVLNLQTNLDLKFDKSGGTVNGNVLVLGNVTILGTATTINTQTLSIADNIITLNSNVTGGTPFVGDSGIEVLRGSATTATILWKEQNSQWEAGLQGTTKRIILEGDSLALLTSGHTHPISEINGLQTSLNNKFDTSGGTITGNVLVTGSVSATTFYGNGQYLTGLVTNDFYVTGGTFTGTTLILYRQNGSVTITGFTATSSGGGTFTGGTVNGFTVFTNGLSANTISTPITNTQVVYSNNGTLTGSTNLTWRNSTSLLTVSGNTLINGVLSASSITILTTPTLSTTNNQVLTRNSTTGNVEYRDITSISTGDTFVTGFTYSNNNVTITQNLGRPALTVNISTMTGLTVAGNLTVTGSTSLRSFTARAGVISGTGQSILTIVGSGSSTSLPLFTVQGSSGELFSVSDSLQGSLFSVNDISGLPILEVFSDNTTLMGSYLAPSLNTTVRSTLTAGTNTIYSIPTSAYTGAFFDYALIGSAGARAGNIMSIFSGVTVQFTEVTTNDIGNTTPVSFSMSVSSGLARLSSSATTTGWTLKTIVRSI